MIHLSMFPYQANLTKPSKLMYNSAIITSPPSASWLTHQLLAKQPEQTWQSAQHPILHGVQLNFTRKHQIIQHLSNIVFKQSTTSHSILTLCFMIIFTGEGSIKCRCLKLSNEFHNFCFRYNISHHFIFQLVNAL